MALLKDIFASLLSKIFLLQEDSNLNPLTYVESQLRYKALIKFIKLYIENANDKPSYINNLKPCLEYICTLYIERKDTIALAPYSETSRANQACMQIAKSLGAEVGMDPYAILMPPLYNSAPNITRKKLSDFKLHEFIIGDDGSFIEVQKCLETALEEKTFKLKHPSNQRLLTTAERERIINHSEYALEFARSIIAYVAKGDNSYLDKQKAFVNAIRADDYHVTADYGIAGEEKLSELIIRDTPNHHEFVELMIDHILPIQWQEYISKFKTKSLRTLFVGENTLVGALQGRSAYIGDPKHDKGVLFCFCELYHRELAAQLANAADNEWLPAHFKKRLGITSVKDRFEAVKLLKQFLISDEPLEDFESYVQKHAHNPEHYAALFEIFTVASHLSKQIIEIAKPEYFQPKPSLLQRWFS